ncbi:MAG: NfeD family protein [Longimicrobiales bacterium]
MLSRRKKTGKIGVGMSGQRLLSILIALALSIPALVPSAAAAQRVVYRIPIRGVIELGLAPFVERSIRDAERQNAAAIILELETPGGRVDAAQRVVRALQDTRIPTYAFVNQHAFSAGAFIALAADGIYMRPGSVMGAATPVDQTGTKAPEKIVSAMRSEMRALAQLRGLDPAVAEGMVDETIEVPGVKPRGQLLTLTDREAVRLRYAVAAGDIPAVLQSIGAAGATVITAHTNWAENLVRFLTNPMVAPLLLSLGFLGLIVELKAPGLGLAGATGLVCLGLFFGSHYLVGLAGLEEILVLIVGAALIIVEAFVLPGFGVFGIAGIIAILGSVYLSLVGSLSTPTDHGMAAAILSTALLVVLVGAWAIVRSLPRSGRFARSGLMLGNATDRETGYISATVRTELVGSTGVALTDLRPSGTAEVGDERLDVVADGEWISAGTPIKVVRSEGYRHIVKRSVA